MKALPGSRTGRASTMRSRPSRRTLVHGPRGRDVAARLSPEVLRESARHQPHASGIEGVPSSYKGGNAGKLRVGSVTSDFGAHPVSATLRGAPLALTRTVTYVFILLVLRFGGGGTCPILSWIDS